MIETSTLFSQKIADSSRQFRARLLYEGDAVSGEIRNITINKGACGESFSIGSIYSSYIEVTLDECEEILENKELLLQIGLVIDDTVEYIDMGYYTVTKPSRSTYQTTFTAVGRITSKLNCLPTLPTEQTLVKLAAAITEATGIQIICKGVTLAGTIEEDLTGLTCRELIEVITAVLGGFATEDNAGNIVISKFSTADLVHFNGERTITDPEFSDYDYELTGVKVITTEEWEDEDGAVHSEVSFTEGTPRQTLSMKYMTESLFSAFKANVVGYTYRPGTIPLALGDPRLEPWDCILYTDAKGNAYVVPCLSIVHTFDGGLSTVITAPGESESESESQVKGPIIQQLERFNSLLITVQEAIIKRLKTDELEAAVAELGYASIEELEAKIAEFGYLKTDELEAEVAEFGYAKIETLDTDYARLDQANITQAWVMDLMVTGNFLADDFNAATGSFSKWLTGVNIVGDMIKGGTVETERLIIRDPETNRGILYEINNGVVDQTNLTEEELKRLCLDGKILVAESVTADKINVTDLFSQNITATGNFNLGEGGVLVYDADTDTLTIRAKEILMSSGMSVEEGLAEVKHASLIEAYDEYATSSSANVEPADDEWSTDKPTAGDGIYIWQRRANVYGNGDIVYGPAVCITGSKGATGEAASNLRIYSSRGTVFKNNTTSTVLSVTIFRGDERITDADTLRSIYGSVAYLQWSWIKGEDTGLILPTDSRLSNNGFSFTLSPDDVDSNITFQCDLIIG